MKLLINFIDTTILYQMEELPPGCFAGLRLAYNDGNALIVYSYQSFFLAKPTSWQAPGFERSETRYNIKGLARSMSAHYVVNTGHHRLFMEVESALIKEKPNFVVSCL